MVSVVEIKTGLITEQLQTFCLAVSHTMNHTKDRGRERERENAEEVPQLEMTYLILISFKTDNNEYYFGLFSSSYRTHCSKW